LRVLKPGGKFIFTVWDHIGVNEFADIVTQTASAEFSDDLPRFLTRIPHGYNNVRLIQQELSAAGYSNIPISTVEKKQCGAVPASCRHCVLQRHVASKQN